MIKELKEWREERNISQDEAAKFFGVSRPAWSFWETGRRRPPKMLFMLIELLNIPPVRTRENVLKMPGGVDIPDPRRTP